MNFDLMTVMNTIFSFSIAVMGYWGFQKKHDKAVLLIGIAFAFFALSHMVHLFGYGARLANFVLVLRVFAYLSVIFVLYGIVTKKI